MAVSRDLSEEDKTLCIWALAPAAFGVFPGVSIYGPLDGAASSDQDKNEYFYDRSEVILALSAAATCREDYEVFGPDCPYRLMLKIFSHHGEVAEKLGYKE